MNAVFVVFDFDGTLADSRLAFLDIINRLADEFGYQPVSNEEADKMRRLSSKEIVQQSKVPPVKIPFLLRRLKRELSKEIVDILPIPGIETSLRELKDCGFELGILTSNLTENVNAFLEKNNLQNLFTFVYSENNLFGKDKALKKVFKRHEIAPENSIYVGDETRDIEAARKMKVKCIAVSWGFNAKDALARYQPDFLVDDPQELIRVIQSVDDASRLREVSRE
ncbi:HAD hydrolase-like protein [Lusitaniella coriacea LEGE 07157]|uniref:HAD hydrolase-like protein n=1 Tax=Lusitaniella coriacea LEGE 07157 TaxID=945747 RepID=A0A8J7IT89_9CYAN|nr:HAD hydrolase-like protein [Lusitaniella coriacea]MBE9115708.1 HAD hydrolase-like protein [Lusitaniella coriacea LEGE 07157]